MTKTTREIERRSNVNVLVISILISILVGYFVYSLVPHRVCHYENKVTEVIVGCSSITDIPANVERICEEGVQGEASYKNLPYENIVWYCNGGFYDTKKCWYREKIKVCEIK